MTHAFFKALLFLAAGSVIIAMHHEQDMRKMGGLRKYMPITYGTSADRFARADRLPGLRRLLLQGRAASRPCTPRTCPAATYAYWCVLIGVFVTAFYSFRLVFMTFHGEERMDHHTQEHLHESPWVVTLPLMLLAIPSVVIGWFTIEPLLFGDYFGEAIRVSHDARRAGARRRGVPRAGRVRAARVHGPGGLARAGGRVRWPGSCTCKRPALAARPAREAGGLYTLLENKYYFDWFNENVIAAGSRALGKALWKGGDVAVDRRRGGQRLGARWSGWVARTSPAACSPVTSITMPSR